VIYPLPRKGKKETQRMKIRKRVGGGKRNQIEEKEVSTKKERKRGGKNETNEINICPNAPYPIHNNHSLISNNHMRCTAHTWNIHTHSHIHTHAYTLTHTYSHAIVNTRTPIHLQTYTERHFHNFLITNLQD